MNRPFAEIVRSSARPVPRPAPLPKKRPSHPNRKYCPDLFRLPRNRPDLLRCWYRLEDRFPGQTPWRFLEEFTFFRAAAAPEDWTDLYGEPFSGRDQVYVVARPGDIDRLSFYSSEELVSSFVTHFDFVDPGSRTNERFHDRQIERLLLLAEDDNPALEAVIQEIKFARDEAVQQMREMSQREGFRDCLALLLQIGMFMRGWSGTGPYPLIEKNTHRPVDLIKLSERLISLKERLETDWQDFRPLRLIQGREPGWRLSSQTLWERLSILLEGEHEDSCIRMTSGLYAMTAWFCLDRFFGEVGFSLEELDEIY